uniref:C2H2-type domain-containing protein n=1 Tax=Clytia hemisphaerica TaxID=252671 RepID=A0A7M5XG70_9CNID
MEVGRLLINEALPIQQSHHQQKPPVSNPVITFSLEIRIQEFLAGLCNLSLQNLFNPLFMGDQLGNLFSFVPVNTVYSSSAVNRFPQTSHHQITFSVEIKTRGVLVGTCNISFANIYKPMEIHDGRGNMFLFFPNKEIYKKTFLSIDDIAKYLRYQVPYGSFGTGYDFKGNNQPLATIDEHYLRESYLECKECGKWFSLQNRFDKHMATDHVGVMTYHCQNCGKGFTTSIGLKNHNKPRQRKSMFRCEVCSKKFKRKCTLTRH